ncbi:MULTISPECIES: BTAD domain-containing putative transcriptional regulator [unclassified Saccharopolyspora]|uniref:AfsR/SARP family transcriptional regulator n=1 Tax=unclassified Saccharopolyspora TaxID=2646250 RepID=UPI001CD75D01|nr:MULTISPECIES: BTAD domain-containing putative transcriptional regulator [unclassified Saccharopolyspora]MCA1194758.1 tetratricopeptide repeat protein [Saccharopolyspora sp. 6V]MCA1282418.1 tetratricopeptide repeat protein [Saccharopolyspora sp. 7B]
MQGQDAVPGGTGSDQVVGSGPPGFTFRVLGPLEVRLDGEPLRLGSASVRGAFACLLMEPNQLVSIDRLIDTLWGDEPPATARTIVHGYISRIRRLLHGHGDPDAPGRPEVLTRSPGYLLRIDPERVDAHRARKLINDAHGKDAAARAELLTEALQLWRGPVLSGIAAERLHQSVGTNLDELRLLALEERIASELELGRHHRLVIELSALVDQHPLRERLTYLLMLAGYRSGNRAEAQARYHALRERLSHELGIDPGPEVRTLYERLLRDDEALLSGTQRQADREVAPVGPVPAELPPAVAGFVGREREMAVLDRMIERDRGDTTMLAVLTGTAGVGKSAVAITWAHRVATAFPDGQLYASLRGFDSERAPLSPGEALTSMLKTLGVAADAIPVDLDDRAALYRSLLADRRVLVLLDNARDSEQVRPLVPSSSRSLVLVTSRRRLDGLVVRSGARVLPLETLPTESAVALLDRAGGIDGSAAEPEATRALAELCGGLPLALRIAAARLAANPARGVASLVRELTDEGNRLHALDIDDADTSVRRAFDISYRNLHPVHASTFRRLGLVPGHTFTAHAVAAVCETDPPAAYRRLRALALAHLVTEPEPDRFGMHDLLRLYARELLTAPDGPDARPEHAGLAERDEKAFTRLLHYYLVVADHARRFLRPARDDLDLSGDSTIEQPEIRNRTEALAWFDSEWPNLVAAVRAAHAHGLHEYAWRLVRCQFNYLVVRCPWEDWIQIYTVGLESARLAADPVGQVLMPAGLGVAYARTGEHDEALAHYADSYRCAVATGSPGWLAMAQVNMGAVLFRMKRFAEAQVHCRDALRAYRTLGDRYREAGALNNLAQVEQANGRLAEALEHLLEAEVMYREADDLETLAMVLNNCGEVSIELGRLDDGEGYHHEALDVAQRCGSAMHQASAYLGLGDVAVSRGDRSVARTRWETALSIYETGGSPRAAQAKARLTSLDDG